MLRGAVSVHEDDRTSPYPCKHVGTSPVIQQLRKSSRADRPGADLLAQLHHPQMQAKDHQDHPVLDQDEAAEHDPAVCCALRLV